VILQERGRNEIDAQGAVVNRALPRQFDPPKPAIDEFGNHLSVLIG
jgi:hypothetical protein